MGVAVSWFVPEAYHGNTFHSNVPSLSCIDNQTLWTTDCLNCNYTQQGNTHEPWVLQNFGKKCLSWICLNNPCLIPAGVCVSPWARPYLLLTVNHAQLHAVTPKQLLPSWEQSSEKNISDISGHCVLSYPWASFLRPEKFVGWLRGMCTLLGKKTKKKNFLTLHFREMNFFNPGGKTNGFCFVLKLRRLLFFFFVVFFKRNLFDSFTLMPTFSVFRLNKASKIFQSKHCAAVLREETPFILWQSTYFHHSEF